MQPVELEMCLAWKAVSKHFTFENQMYAEQPIDTVRQAMSSFQSTWSKAFYRSLSCLIHIGKINMFVYTWAMLHWKQTLPYNRAQPNYDYSNSTCIWSMAIYMRVELSYLGEKWCILAHYVPLYWHLNTSNHPMPFRLHVLGVKRPMSGQMMAQWVDPFWDPTDFMMGDMIRRLTPVITYTKHRSPICKLMSYDNFAMFRRTGRGVVPPWAPSMHIQLLWSPRLKAYLLKQLILTLHR